MPFHKNDEVLCALWGDDNNHIFRLEDCSIETMDVESKDVILEGKNIDSLYKNTVTFNCDINISNELMKSLTIGDIIEDYDWHICLIQVRRHKKRRINKKWAKKYGYIKCIYPIEKKKNDELS